MDGRKGTKKRNYSEMEVDVLTSEVDKVKNVLFAGANQGVGHQIKNKMWDKITERVNSVSEVGRTKAEVCLTCNFNI